jgi:hypothetical protein
MTLKEIKKHYRLEKYIEDGNRFLVYSKNPGTGMRMVFKYFCLITRVGTKFFVDGYKPTSNIDVLKNQIEDYVLNLKYDSEYFNPHFIEGTTEELIIHDYMNKLGFKSDMYSDDLYKLSNENVYGYITTNISVSFSGLKAFDRKDRVAIYVWISGTSFIKTEIIKTIESIKEGIDSLLKPLLISDSINNFNTAEKMENDTMDIDILLSKINQSLDMSSQDYKSKLKERLLELTNKI